MLKSSKVLIKNQTDVYAMMTKYDTFPDITVDIQKPSAARPRELLSAALSRRRAKAYIFCSLFLLAASFFTSLSILYLSFSTLSLILAFLSFLNLNFTKTSDTKNEL
jgi:4-hydroxybenzoate polyprenyltransferase